MGIWSGLILSRRLTHSHQCVFLYKKSRNRFPIHPSLITSKNNCIYPLQLHLAPYQKMPPILTTSTSNNSQRDSFDRPQFCVILAVLGIVLIQTTLAIAYIRFLNLNSKARWRRLRQRGVVIVDGPALIWTNEIPPAPLTSTFNLRQASRRSNEQATQ